MGRVGAARTGTVPVGAARTGTAPAGAAPTLTALAGAAPTGTAPVGAARTGTAPVGATLTGMAQHPSTEHTRSWPARSPATSRAVAQQEALMLNQVDLSSPRLVLRSYRPSDAEVIWE